MKFGKYIGARQLELPEYSSYFINYKQLKKLINALTQDGTTTLQDKKGSFFFRLERELEKVNEFYLEKESELRFRLDLLIEKKNKSIKENSISKNSITFISLYDGFKKFSKDLDRLEQFVELNETGFTKVLKKWDKRSKSSTKELYLTTAVNVQPIFHRNQIVELSDLVANNLMELEALSDGEKSFIRYNSSEKTNSNNNNNNDQIDIDNDSETISDHHSRNYLHNSINNIDDDINLSDQLYTDFYEITLQNVKLPTQEQLLKLKEWSNQIISKLNTDTKKFTFSKVFMLLISNLQIPNESILLFYEFFKEFIDLDFIDDLNGRTCLIEASTCKEGRNEIVKLCLDSNIDPSIKDITGRTCLHYLTENGRDDLLISILSYIKENKPNISEIIDSQDNDSISPLLLAIINNHVSSVKILLDFNANGFPKQNDLKPMYLPLNVACKFGNLKIVELLLHQYGSSEKARNENLLVNSSQCNAEGLLPLHIVASSGNSNLVPLLLEYGADINQIDKLNKWSSIFYSVFTNDKEMTKSLIDYGANFNLKDEDGFNPLYYAIWEGNISVFNILLESMRLKKFERNNSTASSISVEKSSLNKVSTTMDSVSLKPLNPIIDLNNIDLIPELSLPPPIIPLRKYGHNFLEKKIFLKISFYTNRFSINLNPNVFLTSIPGRITISNNELIPRNILLPVLDTEKVITFQLDSIDANSFEIDFELFPTFGTRLLAKSTLTSSILKSQYPGLGTKNAGYLELPLLDVRLRTIGSLRFTYELIYPYSGKPLEISMYDTYWKLSSSSDENEKKKKKDINLTSFVTSSSLNGEYYGIHICSLHDGTPIVCPKLQVEVAPNVYLPITLFTFEQLSSVVYKDLRQLDELREILRRCNSEELKKNFHNIISNVYLPLNEFLNLLDSKISLNLEIFYPSTYELENYDLKEFAYISIQKDESVNNDVNNNNVDSMLSTNNLNYFIDAILTDIFTHVRKLRSNHTSNNISRQIVLTSNNPNVCTILNWKQPNYPVFYNINGIKYNKKLKEFTECTSNGIWKKINNSPINASDKITEVSNTNGNKISIDNIDSINKDSTEYISLLDYDDKLTRSIKLAINYACANNLLGITVPERILNLSPEIVKSIRSKGLILVATKDDSADENLLVINDNTTTQSNDKFDVNNIVDDNVIDLDEDIRELETDGEIRANGLRFKDILTFTDAIEV
jgi:CDK inhibitor PHO81